MADINMRIDIHIYLESGATGSSGIRRVMDLFDQHRPKLLSMPEKVPRIDKVKRETLRNWRGKIQDDLYDLTGVDIVALATQKVIDYPRWSIYSMSCAKCGKSWVDGVALARHHRIPIKLGRFLGLTGKRLGVSDNLICLCIEDHLEADLAVRNMVKEKYPEMYCWGT